MEKSSIEKLQELIDEEERHHDDWMFEAIRLGEVNYPKEDKYDYCEKCGEKMIKRDGGICQQCI